MKKITLTSLALILTLLINAQTVNPSKVYSNNILKSKPSDTTMVNNTIISYKNRTNSKVIKPIKGYSNRYFFSYKDSSLVSKGDVIQQLSKQSQLKNYSANKSDTLRLVSSTTDELGFTHSKYHQYYKGIPVIGGTMIFHEKEGAVKHVNGNYYKNINIDTLPSYSFSKALEKAQLESNETISSPLKELIITPLNGDYNKQDFRLCYKFSFINQTIFIDAHTGETVNKIQNSSQLSVVGSANTLYNGVQSIQTEFVNGKYYLYDSIRNIYTFDGTNDSRFIDGNPFNESSPSPLFNTSNDWNNLLYLDDLILSQVNDNWYAPIFDTKPDLYIKIFDAENTLVYVSNVLTNINPPINFLDINIPLNNPPYHLYIYDSDNTTDDDLCGVFELSQGYGEFSFNSNQNSGIYNISGGGYHLATDVHWGLEETYDFYLNILGQKSYDGDGAPILSWVNPNLYPDWNTNNAFASHFTIEGRVFDFMCYGLGDGSNMNPVVTIDVIAHEFTHMVTNYSADLIYQGESGALNESFSDIFGTCVEVFTKGTEANWTIGEGVMVTSPFMRSMSDPNYTEDPATYKGNYWKNVENIDNDHGGVHSNNGVMNYWFYLLTQGGSGVNDNSDSYNIQGIGIEKAAQIAYRTLTVYLTENSDFLDAYNSSLQAAEDLYGENSQEWWSVKNAWYAVGVITTDPNLYCSGQTKLTDVSGTISDGSGSANYMSNSECEWLIVPPGATSITIDFTSFDTEMDYDSLVVYSSIYADPMYAQLVWSGSTLPPTYTINGGAALIKFYSDASVEANGWELNYTTATVPTCQGYTIFKDTYGTFTDNSGVMQDYGNNQSCLWVIAPPGAQIIELDITALDTELDCDGLIVFDGEPDFDNLTNLIGTYTGTVIPSSLYAYSGEMWVIFTSDPFITGEGFSATYSVTASPFCEGVSVLTNDFGIIEDGSYSEDYYSNSSCGWLIQPKDATSITLQFSEFSLEEPEEDGKSFYDFIEVFDGTDETAPSLGKFGGSLIPAPLTSSSGTMFVKFYSDYGSEFEGFRATYFCQTETYCSSQSIYTDLQNVISDGSADKEYGNNSDCQILIQPPFADSIILNFTSFNTEENYDGVIIYDGADTSAMQLAVLSGNVLPETIIAKSGSMLIWFISDESYRDLGWEANYYTVQLPITIANFEVDAQSGKAPLNIEFRDLSTQNPTSWYWEFEGGTPSTSTEQNPKITYYNAGIYQVSLTSTNNIGSNTITKTSYISVTTNTNSVDNVGEEIISFFPNPTDGLLHIETNKDFDLELCSTTGSVLVKTKNKNSIDLSDLENGIYILTIRIEGKLFSNKIIKQ